MIYSNQRPLVHLNRGTFSQIYPLSDDDYLATPFYVQDKQINEFVGKNGEFDFEVQDVEMVIGSDFYIKVHGPGKFTVVTSIESNTWTIDKDEDIKIGSRSEDGTTCALRYNDEGAKTKMGMFHESACVIVIEESKGMPVQVTLYRIKKKLVTRSDIIREENEQTIGRLFHGNMDDYERQLDKNYESSKKRLRLLRQL